MRDFTPEAAINLVWFVWAVSWLLASLWATRAQNRPALGMQAGYHLITAAGFALLFFTFPPGAPERPLGLHPLPLPAVWTTPLWGLPEGAGWACAVLAVAGFAFAWWARIHLGTLWSGTVTLKADHRIVDTGPYRLVRHPIYTGLIVAALAMALVRASPAALLGAGLITFGCWVKGRLEERFLSAELGPEAYAAYRRRVPMLVPFLR